MRKRVEAVSGPVDFHCDALCKLLTEKDAVYAGGDANQTILDVTRERLSEAGAGLQVFAIYIPEEMNGDLKPVLRSVDLFYRHIAAAPGTVFVRNRGDLARAASSGRLGAMLSLEGVDGLQGDLGMLHILYYLGVRAVGITWNHANWAADGVLEPRQGGLTRQGKALVRECVGLGLLLDVSHLAEKGFWEVADMTVKPIVASHANAMSVCSHPRNLTDDQIRAIIAQDGRIGITFVPWFLRSDGPARIDDVIRHVEHVCSLGGERQVMFGSDYDGIDTHVEGLRSPADAARLREALLKRYSEAQTDGFLRGNAWRFLSTHLPD